MKRTLSVIVLLLFVLSLTGCKTRYEPPPKITEGEFPFVVEYEYNGERVLIEDTIVCTYDGYDMSNNFAIFGYPYSRTWDITIKSGKEPKRTIIEFEENSKSVFVKGRVNTESRVIWSYGTGGYYMGDPEDAKTGPFIHYFERYNITSKINMYDSTELTKEQLEKYFGIKLIRFEFSEPIVNTFE